RSASRHGWRWSSSSAWPEVIFAMLAGGWKSSASANGTRRRWAMAAPTVDLPEPDTPITTTTGADGRVDGWADRWADRWADGWADRGAGDMANSSEKWLPSHDELISHIFARPS